MAHGVFTPGAATEPGADITTGAETEEEASQLGEALTPGAATEPGADLTTGAATEEASQAGEAKGVDGASIGERVVDLSGFDDSSTGSECEDIGKRCDM